MWPCLYSCDHVFFFVLVDHFVMCMKIFIILSFTFVVCRMIRFVTFLWESHNALKQYNKVKC